MIPIEFIWRVARSFPEQVAIYSPEGDLTFRALAEEVIKRACAISALDSLEEGAVCIGASNSRDHLLAILAVLAAGKIWVPLNPRGGDPELHRIISFAQPKLVLVDDSMASRISAKDQPLRLLSDIREGSGKAIAMGPTAQAAFARDRTQAIKFTGGTTGIPKGVKQPIRAWTTNIVTQMHAMTLGPEDRYLVAAPLTHGTSTFVLPVLASGGALIFPETSKPADLLAAAERYRASMFFAPPTLILALINEQRRSPRKLHSMRHLVYGGAPMRPDQIRDAQSCFGAVVCTSYGQTEAPQIATFLPPRQMTEENLASVGQPTFLMQAAILDTEGIALPPGKEGEIALRGDLVMTGYLNAPEETSKTLRNGWLMTGDIGFLDERGFLFLKDRLRDLIITGGFNVYPGDVESVIAAHPAVLDCSVFGVPDEKWGEAVHAAVQLRPGTTLDEGELMAMVKRELGSVKTPKEVHLFDSLPKSGVGKVLKSAIRQEVLKRRKAAMIGEAS